MGCEQTGEGAAEVTTVACAARGHFKLTQIALRGVSVAKVVDPGSAAGPDKTASASASAGVVDVTVGASRGAVAVGGGAKVGSTLDDARLVGEVGAASDALGRCTVGVALAQPVACD